MSETLEVLLDQEIQLSQEKSLTENKILGVITVGKHRDVNKACEIANKEAVKILKSKGTCMTKAVPKLCYQKDDGFWVCKATVANHHGSCNRRSAEYGPYVRTWDWPVEWDW